MIVWLFVFLLVVATASGFVQPQKWSRMVTWLLDLPSNFRFHLLVASWVLALAAAAEGNAAATFIALVCAAANLATILVLYSRRKSAPFEMRTLSVHFMNLNERNNRMKRVAREIRSVAPDVVALAEIDAAGLAELRLRLPEYRYHIVREIGPRTAGIAMLSKIAPKSMRLVDTEQGGSPLAVGVFEIDGRLRTVIAAHPMPPSRLTWFEARNAYLERLAEMVRTLSGEVILVGDINAAPWSRYVAAFLERSSLRDTRIGFGVLPTWPAALGPLGVPIDHAFISRGLRTVIRRVHGRAGSDHRGISVVVGWEREGRG